MSTAGVYNYHIKVMNQNKVLPQMKSDELQPPFFFGGSQVPINLGVSTGSGIHTPYISHTKHAKHMTCEGRGIGVTIQKNHKIYLPKHMTSILK